MKWKNPRRVGGMPKFEVQVKWRDLEEVDMTWEPAVNLMEVMPKAFEKYNKCTTRLMKITRQ